MSSLLSTWLVGRRLLPVMAALSISVALICSATALASSVARAKDGLPTSCPSVSLVTSKLRVKLTRVTSQKAVPQYPYGSPALPTKRAPSLVVVCTYSTSGKFTSSSNIVPVTISFASAVSKKDFSMARRSASEGATPVTLHDLGDVAFLVKPPKYDPRAGSSLFVLAGTVEISIAAPPTASGSGLLSLARKLA